MAANPSNFADQLLAWFDEHGRKNLPWQQNKTPYKVWISEIMLQQTQVATVIPYFERFMARFPSVQSLAAAPLDEVLGLWTGLGYYARARNMHKAARQIADEFNGELPTSVAELITLPGIGESTAGAIVTLGHGGFATILDGNVKRVLARHREIEGWYGRSAVMKKLWQAAEAFTPETRTPDYTQAIMDLGALVCTKSAPHCDVCPVSEDCLARLNNRIADLPGKKPRKAIPTRARFFLQCVDPEDRVLLIKRPANGIWGGLWCFPEFDTQEAMSDWLTSQNLELHCNPKAEAVVEHQFSHYRLHMRPYRCRTKNIEHRITEADTRAWFTIDEAVKLGLPAPVLGMLRTMMNT